MEYTRGYKLLRQDPEWAQKLLLLSLCILSSMIIPLVGQIVVQGWLAGVFRRVVKDPSPQLPPLKFEMEGLGKLLGAGIKPFIVQLLWSLPMIAVSFIVAMGGYAVVIAGAMSGDEELLIGAAICFGVGMLVLLPVSLVLWVPVSVAKARTEYADDLGAGLKVGEVLAFSRQHLGAFVKLLLVHMLFGLFVLLPVTVLTCYLGLFPLAVLTGLSMQVSVADIYREHIAAGGTPWPEGPAQRLGPATAA